MIILLSMYFHILVSAKKFFIQEYIYKYIKTYIVIYKICPYMFIYPSFFRKTV